MVVWWLLDAGNRLYCQPHANLPVSSKLTKLNTADVKSRGSTPQTERIAATQKSRSNSKQRQNGTTNTSKVAAKAVVEEKPMGVGQARRQSCSNMNGFTSFLLNHITSEILVGENKGFVRQLTVTQRVLHNKMWLINAVTTCCFTLPIFPIRPWFVKKEIGKPLLISIKLSNWLDPCQPSLFVLLEPWLQFVVA